MSLDRTKTNEATEPTIGHDGVDIHAELKAAVAAPRWLQGAWVKIAVGALTIVVVALFAWFFGGTTTATRYVTNPVAGGKLTVIVTATGSVQPTKKVDISSELSGTVRAVHVDYNSTISAGQLLAELDTDKLIATVDSSRAKLDTARAKIAEAQATITEKQQELERKKSLASKEVSSVHDLQAAEAAYDRAVASLESARAETRAAQAQLKLDETNLTKSRIVSPIGGTVLKRNVEPGQTIASTLQAPTLFSIAEDLRQMEVQIDVDEADVGKVHVGQRGSFTVDAYPGRRFPAEIRLLRFASETVQGVVTYKAVLVVDNSELLLRPGMTATAEIVVNEVAEAILIPNASLRYAPSEPDPAESRSFLQRVLPGPPRFRTPSKQETGSDRTIWLLRNSRPQQVTVAIGASDGKLTEILSGDIKVGDAVVVDEVTAARD